MKAVVMKVNEENGDFLLKVSNFSEYYTKYDEMSIFTNNRLSNRITEFILYNFFLFSSFAHFTEIFITFVNVIYDSKQSKPNNHARLHLSHRKQNMFRLQSIHPK